MKVKVAEEGTREEEILRTIIEKESWEEIIYYIVGVEKLDPWNVDLVRLAESFIRFISGVQELDFRIPAKVVFVAGILLRMKAEYLSLLEESGLEEEEDETAPVKGSVFVPEVGDVGVPLKRVPKRKITLEELISALRKAIAAKERRERRRMRARVALEAELSEEDVRKLIEEVFSKIKRLVESSGEGKVKFRELVGKWERGEITRNFVPLLHLEQEKRVYTEQEKMFDEIYIGLKEAGD